MCIADKSITELMTSDPISVDASALLNEVALIFENQDFHHVPVVDEDKVCIGVISKSDYYQLQDKFTLFGCGNSEKDNDRFFSTITAEEVITEDLVHLNISASVKDALDIFMKNKVHSIVVQDNGVLKGIITPYDLLEEINVMPCLDLIPA